MLHAYLHIEIYVYFDSVYTGALFLDGPKKKKKKIHFNWMPAYKIALDTAHPLLSTLSACLKIQF